MLSNVLIIKFTTLFIIKLLSDFRNRAVAINVLGIIHETRFEVTVVDDHDIYIVTQFLKPVNKITVKHK